MSKEKPRNLAASVRQRRMNLARARNEDFQFVVTRYALERLLYRLSESEHRDVFVRADSRAAAVASAWRFKVSPSPLVAVGLRASGSGRGLDRRAVSGALARPACYGPGDYSPNLGHRHIGQFALPRGNQPACFDPCRRDIHPVGFLIYGVGSSVSSSREPVSALGEPVSALGPVGAIAMHTSAGVDWWDA